MNLRKKHFNTTVNRKQETSANKKWFKINTMKLLQYC